MSDVHEMTYFSIYQGEHTLFNINMMWTQSLMWQQAVSVWHCHSFWISHFPLRSSCSTWGGLILTGTTYKAEALCHPHQFHPTLCSNLNQPVQTVKNTGNWAKGEVLRMGIGPEVDKNFSPVSPMRTNGHDTELNPLNPSVRMIIITKEKGKCKRWAWRSEKPTEEPPQYSSSCVSTFLSQTSVTAPLSSFSHTHTPMW